MSMSKKIKCLVLLLIDIFFINISYIGAMYYRYGLNFIDYHMNEYLETIGIIVLLYIIPMYLFKLYKSVWRIIGIDEGIKVLCACFTGMILTLFYINIFNKNIENIIIILSSIFILLLVGGIRISYRVARRLLIYRSIHIKNDSREKILVVGAGSCGQIVIDEMIKNRRSNMRAVAIVDDNRNKIGTYIKGVKVCGKCVDIENIVRDKQIDKIIIAIASLSGKDKKRIIEICQKTTAKIKIVPGMYEILDGKVNLTKMRDVDLRDLLGREEVLLDKEGVKEYIEGRKVLVTGGGGSIGSELCRQIAKYNPKELMILDIYENNAYDIQNELKRNFPDIKQRVFIASVRDKWRMNRIFREYRPEIVFHAAAHKHVPLMEDNPEEAIKNNIIGTLNTAELSSEYGVYKFVLISTDKAVNPTNIMGATKRCCEMIVQALNKESETEFVAVRFGNVLGSNGSVIPLFKKEIDEGGPITLTHKEITRYFMLIPEAAQLVLQAGAFAQGGEIFVLDMGKPVKIYDLAEKLIKLSGYEPNKDINIDIVGLRPGEKLYEELLMNEEGLTETKHKKIFIGRPGDFDIVDLKQEISELIDVALIKGKKSIKEKMKEFIPTYKEKFDENEDEVAATVKE